MKIAVVNSSFRGMKPADRIYNLACDRIATLHRAMGDEVIEGEWQPAFMQECVKFYFSVIFTWDIPAMIQAVQQVQSWGGRKIEIGGPAATFMHRYIEEKTGVKPHIGLDNRFERVRGNFKMTFTSRGCVHDCAFCGVKKVEPKAIEYEDYGLSPMISDNNILSTSPLHQLRFINKYAAWGKKVDINSGFDVRFFQERDYDMYSQLNIFCWRFAFDSMDVWQDVWRVGTLMRSKGLDRHHCQFYCLIGFPGQSPEDARFRLDAIRLLGHQPYPMRFIPINSLTHKYVAPGWTEEELFRFQTYYQTPNLWMATKFEDFRPGKNIVKIPDNQIPLEAGE